MESLEVIPHAQLCSKCRERRRVNRQRWCTTCKTNDQARRRQGLREELYAVETASPWVVAPTPVVPVLELEPDPPRVLCRYCASMQWRAVGERWQCEICRYMGPAL
jgi:hypothetical protein